MRESKSELTKTKRGPGYRSAAQYLPGKCKALVWFSVLKKKKERENWDYLTFWVGWFFVVYILRDFNSTPGLFPLNISSIIPFLCWQLHISLELSKYPLWGKIIHIWEPLAQNMIYKFLWIQIIFIKCIL